MPYFQITSIPNTHISIKYWLHENEAFFIRLFEENFTGSNIPNFIQKIKEISFLFNEYLIGYFYHNSIHYFYFERYGKTQDKEEVLRKIKWWFTKEIYEQIKEIEDIDYYIV
jgi:hypothetical protein